MPVTDTVKTIDGLGRVDKTLDRASLRLVQTPQADGIKDPKVMQGIAALQDFLSSQPHVGKTQSLVDLVVGRAAVGVQGLPPAAAALLRHHRHQHGRHCAARVRHHRGRHHRGGDCKALPGARRCVPGSASVRRGAAT